MQVVNGGTLCKELRIGKDVEMDVGSQRVENGAQAVGGATWYSALLDDDLVACRNRGDGPRCRFDVGEVGSRAGLR